MKNTKLLGLIIIMAIAVITASACGGGSSASPNPSPTAITSSAITKPNPTVLQVSATTTGSSDNYYVTLNITVKNQGADGMIIVAGNITQAGQTQSEEMSFPMTSGSSQLVKLVFPLKWKGGEWTPSVQAVIP